MGFFDGWTTKDYLTGALALWGSCLATYQLVAAKRAKKPRVRVKAGVGTATKADDGIYGMLTISASNIGERSVVIGAHYFLYDWQKKNHVGVLLQNQDEKKAPVTLQPGENTGQTWDVSSVAKELIKWGQSGKVQLRAVYLDAIGHQYTSDPFEFDIDHWSKATPIGPMEWIADHSVRMDATQGKKPS